MLKQDSGIESRDIVSKVVEGVQGESARQVFDTLPIQYPIIGGDFDNIADVRRDAEQNITRRARILGRVAVIRVHRNYGFVILEPQDGDSNTPSIQVIIPRRAQDDNGEYVTLEENDSFVGAAQIGSWAVVEGISTASKSGEPSVLVEDIPPIIAAQAFIRPDNLDGNEGLSRNEKREMFERRNNVRVAIRRLLEDSGFTEVITPVITGAASGANADTFSTDVRSIGKAGHLRISPELALKTAIINGYGLRVYEIATDFRNEGIDREHIPEFEMLEFYAAFMTLDSMTDFTKQLIVNAATRANSTTEVRLTKEDGQEIDIDLAHWKSIEYRDIFLDGVGIDLDVLLGQSEYVIRQTLQQTIEQAIPNSEQAEKIKNSSIVTMVDKLFKFTCRPHINQPTFVTKYPQIMSPLARPNDADPRYVDMFQGIVGSMEVVKAYQELNDPVLQLQNLMIQAQAKAAGDSEAMEVDWAYIRNMLRGLPPTAGCGIGIDRLTAIISGKKNIHDTVAYPFKERFSEK